MKQSRYLLISIVGLIVIFVSCSDLKKDLPTATSAETKIHETGWNDSTAANFHGLVLKASSYDLKKCISCHSSQFTGGTSGVRCDKCHSSYPHISGWDSLAVSGNHADYLKLNNWETSGCKNCHGDTLDGGTSGISCYTCHSSYPHSLSWETATAPNHHGDFVKALQWQLSECAKCHGSDFKGGISGKQCSRCHASYPHATSWDSTTTNGFHGVYLHQNNFQLTECTQCHGNDYLGGTSQVSCFTCHSSYPHSLSWETATAPNHHGDYVKALQWQLSECTKCHGSDFSGGISGKQCSRCHASYPHTTSWDSVTANGFHGIYLRQNNFQLTECTQCHGNDYLGGTSQVSCLACHTLYPHSTSWSDASSNSSHGKYIKTQSWSNDSCSACHGDDFTGGISTKGCFTCHSEYPHPSSFSSSHPTTLRNDGYPLVDCQTCHGSNYTGGSVVNVSCERSGCHVDGSNNPKSPETCNTCHGTFSATASDTLSWAPPASVNGATSTSDAGVGAHQKHLGITTISYGQKLVCIECHTLPSTLNASGHLGSPPADVVLSGVKLSGPSANGLSATFNASTHTCANTYCHGNWKASSASPGASTWGYADSIIVGSNYQPRWNGGSTEAACGTCHGNSTTGNPLPTGHIVNNPFNNQPIVRTSCSNCHPTVVDGAGNIIDNTKHMNGKVNVFTTERPL
jgi:hypothetical protein